MRSRSLLFLTTALALCALTVAPLAAQGGVQPTKAPDPESEAEARARMARKGAGLTVGAWELRGIEPPAGVDVSTMPMISGWLRKGLDARLSMENGIGVWRRVQSTPPSGGIGGSAGEEVQSWIIAQTTAIRFFPATDAGARLEPYVLGAGGFTLGIDDRETSGGGLGSATGGSGVSIVPAISLQGGAGIEWRFSESYGLMAGAKFQWTRFFQDFGGERTYQGPVYEVGLSYKFRYR
ncbi:MAG: hypothetical protein KJZ74_04230 [Gemmatimonadales bacterium]|nr:hypothetical protein [Gemmatimonadales bacterium]